MPQTPEERLARNRAYQAAYRAKNREAIRMRRARHYATHREAINAKNRAYAASHPEELRAYQAAYQQSHKAELNAKSAAYHEDHSEELRVYRAEYRLVHRAEKRAYDTEYRAAHPEKMGAHQKNRRARLYGVAVRDFTGAQWMAMQEAYGHRCVYCGRRAKGHLTQDHITPLSKGGNHTLNNIVPACRSCNSRKQAGEILCPIQPLLLL